MGINEEKYNTVWTVLKFNRKKYRKRQTDTRNTKIHDLSVLVQSLQ